MNGGLKNAFSFRLRPDGVSSCRPESGMRSLDVVDKFVFNPGLGGFPVVDVVLVGAKSGVKVTVFAKTFTKGP
jgi:hypothetical protein